MEEQFAVLRQLGDCDMKLKRIDGVKTENEAVSQHILLVVVG